VTVASATANAVSFGKSTESELASYRFQNRRPGGGDRGLTGPTELAHGESMYCTEVAPRPRRVPRAPGRHPVSSASTDEKFAGAPPLRLVDTEALYWPELLVMTDWMMVPRRRIRRRRLISTSRRGGVTPELESV